MAYARMGDDCDVYVYCGHKGITCCMCKLSVVRGVDPLFQTPEEILAHLNEHMGAGHKVVQSAFKRLEEEIRNSHKKGNTS